MVEKSKNHNSCAVNTDLLAISSYVYRVYCLHNLPLKNLQENVFCIRDDRWRLSSGYVKCNIFYVYIINFEPCVWNCNCIHREILKFLISLSWTTCKPKIDKVSENKIIRKRSVGKTYSSLCLFAI